MKRLESIGCGEEAEKIPYNIPSSKSPFRALAASAMLRLSSLLGAKAPDAAPNSVNYKRVNIKYWDTRDSHGVQFRPIR
jgi:hypothetical protein